MSERLISQLSHVELLTPSVEESLQFFTDVMGLEESSRESGLRLPALLGRLLPPQRAADRGPQARSRTRSLAGRRARAARARSGDAGAKRARRRLVRRPDGSRTRLPLPRAGRPRPRDLLGRRALRNLHRTRRRSFPPGLSASRPRRLSPTARPCHRHDPRPDERRRVVPRHARLPLHGIHAARTTTPTSIIFTMVTTNEKSHDLGLVERLLGHPSRLHHLAFWVDTVEDVLRAADTLMESGTHIEFGPGRHGMGEQTYLYFREPGGIRLEINSGGYRNTSPTGSRSSGFHLRGRTPCTATCSMPDSMMRIVPRRAPSSTCPSRRVANPWAQEDSSE